MMVGVPKGLMYWKYGSILQQFLDELKIEYIISPDTSKLILDKGVNSCVDDACLPIKVFHGHVDWLKDKCDLIIVPRIMQLRNREFICPKFCGLVEMVSNSIEGLPRVTERPIYADGRNNVLNWFLEIGRLNGRGNLESKRAFDKAISEFKKTKQGIVQDDYDMKIALLGHPYNIYDNYCNMNIVKKLNMMGIGVSTEECIPEESINKYIEELFKKPFWTFARNSYGAALSFQEDEKINGLIYISSFACGIDSVVIELIKERIGDYPLLVLKIDEQTGEAGVETRLEAFCDMLERRKINGNKFSQLG